MNRRLKMFPLFTLVVILLLQGSFALIEKSSKKCCPDIGCFSNSKGSHFEQYLSFLPQCPDEYKPGFYLYNPTDPDPAVIDYTNLNSTVDLATPDFNADLYVIIHGFSDSANTYEFVAMTRALQKDGQNVLLIDWKDGAKGPNYPQAATNTRSIGRAIGRVLISMRDRLGLSFGNTHVAGHSLGAHVSGFVGDFIGSTKLHRIMGLDPAGPLFEFMNPVARLDADDAEIVQNIHTNGDLLVMGGVGTMQAMGHYDFYANGGKVQAGCNRGVPQIITDIFHMNYTRISEDASCSHSRANFLFLDTIRNKDNTACHYTSFPCSESGNWLAGSCFKCPGECLYPGYELAVGSPAPTGSYWFNTLASNKTEREFCGKQYVVSITSQSTVHGSLSVQLVGGNAATSQNYQIEKNTCKLTKGVPKSTILVLPCESLVQSVKITWKHYVGWFGNKKWDLQSLTVQDETGKTLIADNATITDGEQNVYVK